jgi:hypothetical protein
MDSHYLVFITWNAIATAQRMKTSVHSMCRMRDIPPAFLPSSTAIAAPGPQAG